MGSDKQGKGGFELRSVVKPDVFYCWHLALLVFLLLFSRQATRKGNILQTYFVVAFGLGVLKFGLASMVFETASGGAPMFESPVVL